MKPDLFIEIDFPKFQTCLQFHTLRIRYFWNSKYLFLLLPQAREGNDNPLHYSCLENRMDGGAWQATIHGVTKSWTGLNDFTLTLVMPLIDCCLQSYYFSMLLISCLSNYITLQLNTLRVFFFFINTQHLIVILSSVLLSIFNVCSYCINWSL